MLHAYSVCLSVILLSAPGYKMSILTSKLISFIQPDTLHKYNFNLTEVNYTLGGCSLNDITLMLDCLNWIMFEWLYYQMCFVVWYQVARSLRNLIWFWFQLSYFRSGSHIILFNSNFFKKALRMVLSWPASLLMIIFNLLSC